MLACKLLVLHRCFEKRECCYRTFLIRLASSLHFVFTSHALTQTREEAADEVAHHAGIGCGLVIALRGARMRLARSQEFVVPLELVDMKDLSNPQKLFLQEQPDEQKDSNHIRLTENEEKLLRDAIRYMSEVASVELTKAQNLQRQVPKEARSVLLPVVPAMHYLSRLQDANYNVFDDNLLEQHNLKVLALLTRSWLTGVL